MSVISDQQCDVHLHSEIENLKQALAEKHSQLVAMETTCFDQSDRQVELEDSIIAWQDKYERLYESHKRVQKVNQSLEDKLLKLVDRHSSERAQLTSDVATLSVRLAQANYNIGKLQGEIERYKTDIGLAIQLLQCKPENFVSQKVSALPAEIQPKVSHYMRLDTNSHSDSEGSTCGVSTTASYRVLPASDSPPPVCPFPPTAMVYSMRGLDGIDTKQHDQLISPAMMAKYLEDELKTSDLKHCDTCNCSTKDLTVLADLPKTYTIGTQTTLHGDTNNSLCLRCNSNLNSPSCTTSPYILKLVKSSDSVISETKSSVSDSNENDKLFTPVKKDDLMVNPILGHHRLCDRQRGNIGSLLTDLKREESKPLNGSGIGKPNGISPVTSPVQSDIRQQQIKSPGDSQSSARAPIKSNGVNSMAPAVPPRNSKPLVASSEKLVDATIGLNTVNSDTASSDGVKMFESFNKNLIKTLKAENHVKIPRLCAMRIENGSSNILLDNEMQPIVYTRRSRFLDEELDDTKEVITSQNRPPSDIQISMVMSPVNQDTVLSGPSKGSISQQKDTVIEMKSHENIKYLKDGGLVDGISKKTFTQSSSLSSDMDLNESILLRRQQFNRVAEWVQNSSQRNPSLTVTSVNSSMEALSIDSSQPHQQQQPTKNIKLKCDKLGYSNVNNNIIGDKSTNNIELNVQDSTMPTLSANVPATTATTSMGYVSHPIYGYTETIQSPTNYKCNNSAQLNYQYNNINNNNRVNGQLTTDKDDAQIEYNVRQFLSKQNQWTISNQPLNGTNMSLSGGVDESAAFILDGEQFNLRKLHRTETNL